MARAARRLVICIDNSGYEVSLERRKIYLSIPDARAEKLGQLRVIDESGEDYLYPRSLSSLRSSHSRYAERCCKQPSGAQMAVDFESPRVMVTTPNPCKTWSIFNAESWSMLNAG